MNSIINKEMSSLTCERSHGWSFDIRTSLNSASMRCHKQIRLYTTNNSKPGCRHIRCAYGIWVEVVPPELYMSDDVSHHKQRISKNHNILYLNDKNYEIITTMSNT